MSGSDSLFTVFLNAVLVDNFVLVQFLGLCPFLGVSKKQETALGMGLATTLVLTLSAGLSYLLEHYLLHPEGLDYLRTVVFIVVIAVVVQLTEMIIQAVSPLLHRTAAAQCRLPCGLHKRCHRRCAAATTGQLRCAWKG